MRILAAYAYNKGTSIVNHIVFRIDRNIRSDLNSTPVATEVSH